MTPHLNHSLHRILLMGSPDYALPTFDAVRTRFPDSILAVLTRPDTPKGRGLDLQPTAVKRWALNHHLPVFTPATKQELVDTVSTLNPTLAIVIAYGMILPLSIVESFPCINLHGSILPSYRGASPVQAALLNGDTETGVTLIKMNEKMDEGPILAIKKIPILATDTLGTLFQTLSELSATLCLTFLESTPLNLTGIPQPETHVSYCKKLHAADFQLHPEQDSALQMFHKIRAFSPKPGAYLMVDKKRIKLLEAKLESGKLVPLTVQPEGKKPLPYSQYLLGNAPLI